VKYDSHQQLHFATEKDRNQQVTEQQSTLEDALRGHDEAVESAKHLEAAPSEMSYATEKRVLQEIDSVRYSVSTTHQGKWKRRPI